MVRLFQRLRSAMSEGPPRGDAAVSLFIAELVALAFILVAVERLVDGRTVQFVFLLAISIVFFVLGIRWAEIKQRRLGMIGVGMYCCAVVFGITWWNDHRPGLTIWYQGKPLNGQVVTLTKLTDPTRRQVNMFVETNDPSLFNVIGIIVMNEGDKSLDPDTTVISFAGGIEKSQQNQGPWEPVPVERMQQGWTTYENETLPRIEAEHTVSVWAFRGTPVPTKPMQVRIRVAYGLKNVAAEFTLMPPSL